MGTQPYVVWRWPFGTTSQTWPQFRVSTIVSVVATLVMVAIFILSGQALCGIVLGAGLALGYWIFWLVGRQAA